MIYLKFLNTLNTMETLLKLLNSLKENKKKLYLSIFIILGLLIYLAIAISYLLDIDPFIYFQF
tara:strand:+ start:1466 stop:1654 length:189 start_codon:yes stop_codon:yes gene_type:complete